MKRDNDHDALMASIDADVLTSNVSEDEIESAIRDEGGDPDALADRGRLLAQDLLARRRTQSPSSMQRHVAIRAQRVAPSARWQLLRERIEAARADPRFAAVLDAHAPLDEATEDELWQLVDKLEQINGPIPEK